MILVDQDGRKLNPDEVRRLIESGAEEGKDFYYEDYVGEDEEEEAEEEYEEEMDYQDIISADEFINDFEEEKATKLYG
jgi:hypothetical protein